jgi:ribosomal-protein-alanine N-acetyltransferase
MFGFIRRSVRREIPPVLSGGGLYLRVPLAEDFAAWSVLRATSRAFLEPWEPLWPKDDLTWPAFRRRIKRYQREMRADQAYAFLIFSQAEHQLIGGLTVSYIRRGVTQSGALGYWMGAPFAGKGHMSEAVRVAVPFALGTLRLNRLEAACLPANAASIRLLENNQFQREGYARNYLKINGTWQDHILYARISDEAGDRDNPKSPE